MVRRPAQEDAGRRHEARLIPGSGGERMSTQRKQRLMAETLARCAASRAAVCGFSINSKNAATVDPARSPPPRRRARASSWIRSNLVTSALGRGARRSSGSSATRTTSAERASVRAAERHDLPLRSFEKSLEAVALYSAVNLGAAYRGRGRAAEAPAAAPSTRRTTRRSSPTAAAALAASLRARAPPAAAPRVAPTAPSSRRPPNCARCSPAQELRAWLARAPCLVAHPSRRAARSWRRARSANVTAHTNGLEKVGRARDLRRPPASHGGGGGGAPAGTDDDGRAREVAQAAETAAQQPARVDEAIRLVRRMSSRGAGLAGGKMARVHWGDRVDIGKFQHARIRVYV